MKAKNSSIVDPSRRSQCRPGELFEESLPVAIPVRTIQIDEPDFLGDDQMASQKIPAIVAGMDLNGLGVVRSLAARNVPVIAVDTSFDKPTGRTRFGKKARISSLQGSKFIEDLLALAASLPVRPFLVLTQEDSVLAASEARQELMTKFLFQLPEKSMLQSLLHKSTMQEVAVDSGMPMPKCLHIGSDHDLDAAKSLIFPCVFKPSVKDRAYGERFKKAYRVESFEQLRNLFSEMKDVFSDLVIQEWVSGDDDDIYFCLQYRGHDSHLVSSFVGRKIRSWPPEVGGTASCSVAMDSKDEIEALTECFAMHTKLTGFFSLEFKRHAATGRLMLIEPTVGRTDYQEEVATLNGVNIPYAAYCHETLITPIPVSGNSRPKIWREARVDRWSQEINGKPDPAWATDHVRTDALWRLFDPAPYLFEFWQRIAARITS